MIGLIILDGFLEGMFGEGFLGRFFFGFLDGLMGVHMRVNFRDGLPILRGFGLFIFCIQGFI